MLQCGCSHVPHVRPAAGVSMCSSVALPTPEGLVLAGVPGFAYQNEESHDSSPFGIGNRISESRTSCTKNSEMNLPVAPEKWLKTGEVAKAPQQDDPNTFLGGASAPTVYRLLG